MKCSGDLPCKRCESHENPCKYSRVSTEGDAFVESSSTRCTILEAEVRLLKEQVQQLQSSCPGVPTLAFEANVVDDSDISRPLRAHDPRRPARTRHNAGPTRAQFPGPTSSEFSFNVANSTLHSLGIQPEDSNSRLESALTSRRASPELPDQEATNYQDHLLSLGLPEVYRALDVYKEELDSVYPFIDVDKMIAEVPNLYRELGHVSSATTEVTTTGVRNISVMILKMMVASVLVVEGSGQSRVGQELLRSVEEALSWSITGIGIHLKQLQLFTLTSIYHFHCDEEVLAWRTIGISARIALEMGLHRKENLEKNIPDTETRHWATRLFYCIYVLDRRWSFGTGLPFALHDADIDPDLPDMNGRVPYLGCMVSYGRLSSKVWETMAGFYNKAVDVNKIGYLDFQLQQWRQSLPENLQLSQSHSPRPDELQSRSIQRLQVLLYLRANHLRILLHRHNILSPLSVKENLAGAHLVADVAKDTIRLLVRLRESSTIYETQQSAYNYFLVSALAAIFLAVCHAPVEFVNSCRDEFFDALSLLKDLSAHGYSAKRLWKSLRGLKSIAPQLGLTPSDGPKTPHHQSSVLPVDENTEVHVSAGSDVPAGGPYHLHPTSSLIAPPDVAGGESNWLLNPRTNMNFTPDSMPDMFQMSNDLTDMFEAFSGMHDQGNTNYDMQDRSVHFQNSKEILMLFGDLL